MILPKRGFPLLPLTKRPLSRRFPRKSLLTVFHASRPQAVPPEQFIKLHLLSLTFNFRERTFFIPDTPCSALCVAFLSFVFFSFFRTGIFSLGSTSPIVRIFFR